MRPLSDFDHGDVQRRSALDLVKRATLCRWFGHDWSVTSTLPEDHWTWCGRCRERADYRDVLGGECFCCGKEGERADAERIPF
jgi:hypothetical protein